MKDAPRCPRCDSTVDLPHSTDDACFRTLDREMAAALAQVRLLTSRKGKLVRERIQTRQRTGLLGTIGRRRAGLPIRRLFRSK
jgi:hypothetical protein